MDLKLRDRRQKLCFDSESRATRREVRRLQQRLKSKLTRDTRRMILMKYCSTLVQKRSHFQEASYQAYWMVKITISGSDAKSACKTVNSLLGETKAKYKPSFSAVDFNKFFVKKIGGIRKMTNSPSAPSYTVHDTSNLFPIYDRRYGYSRDSDQRVSDKALQPRPNSNLGSQELRLIIGAVRNTCCQPFNSHMLRSI